MNDIVYPYKTYSGKDDVDKYISDIEDENA